ncbi:MAG: penicillin binding protein PBP4B [Treponema sp.]
MKQFPYFRDRYCLAMCFVSVCCVVCWTGCRSAASPERHKPADVEEIGAAYFSPYPASLHTEKMQFQVDAALPLSSKDADSGILPDNTIPFIAYKGQALIYFITDNAAAFDLYINNVRIPTDAICAQKHICLDASEYIKNGRNILYAARIRSQPTLPGTKILKPSVRIRIPYPVIQAGPFHADSRSAPKDSYSSETLQLLDQLINAEVANGFPGAQLVIVKNGTLIKNAAYGVVSTVDVSGRSLKEPIPVTEDTLFDVASNTKMYAVNFAVQKLIVEKKLFLNDTVQHFFPAFEDDKKAKIKGKSTITVFDLLTHQSGLPAGGAYYKKIQRMKAKERKLKRKRLHTLDLMMKTPLTYQPRSQLVYSDIHYMLLTFIIEKITGMPLDTYVGQHFYKPLELSRICFKPLEHGFELAEIAATQINAKMRGGNGSSTKTALIHGVVHDEEAYDAMEQVSGHAGLFANAKSLAVLAQLLLNGGGYGTTQFFNPAIVGYFTAQQSRFSTMGLGWRRQGAQEYSWAFSSFASEYSFGHTGWTGTLTFIDPVEHLIVILLTNAKNTPPAKVSRTRFEGDYYLIKQYGAILSFIYEAFRHPDSYQLDSMLIELAEKKYAMLMDIKAFHTDGYIGDMAAIMQTIQQRAQHSLPLQHFLQTESAARITEAIAGFNRK